MKTLKWMIDHPDLLVGFVQARGVDARPADPALAAHLDRTVAEAGTGWGPGEATRAALRELLKRGGYKPTGRGKPASEYLAGMAQKGEFPRINALVDINNLLSLRTGWPMSVLDAGRVGGDTLELRLGRAEERYVFNQAGQTIDLAGLLLVAEADGLALGNPVKDAAHAKTNAETRDVFAVLYTSRRCASPEEVRSVAGEYAALLKVHVGAKETRVQVLEGPGAAG